MVFASWDGTTDFDLWRISADGSNPEPLLTEPGDQINPRVSPNKRWLAYVSNHAGDQRVHAMSYPDGAEVVPVSDAGGSRPRWRRDGKELYYLSLTGWLMAVEVLEDGLFRKPERLFEMPIMENYGVSAEGDRFLIAIPLDGEEDSSLLINVVVNWFEELKQRVPIR